MSDVRRTVDMLLKAYGRDESMELVGGLVEDNIMEHPSDAVFFQSVYDLLRVTALHIECVGADKFKVVWHIPPAEAAMRVVK